MAVADRADTVEERAALRPARRVELDRAARLGVIAGVAAIFVASIGMVEDFQTRLLVDELALGYVLFLGVALVFGYVASEPPADIEGYERAVPSGRNVLAGAVAGAGGAVVVVGYLALIGNVDIRSTFINISPGLVDVLTFGRGLPAGTALAAAWFVALGTLGGALHLLPARSRRLVGVALVWLLFFSLLHTVVRTILGEGLGLGAVADLLYESSDALSVVGALLVALAGVAVDQLVTTRRAGLLERVRAPGTSRRRTIRVVGIALGLVALALMPSILGRFLTAVANLAGIYMLLALGLNIVVGFAGLLNLGHVAFLTVGAYTTGVLTAPSGVDLPVLIALPVAILVGALAGVIVGLPVIRMRGDYLAIVTLGFGEIVRLLAVSDWLKPVLGGAQGITRIPNLDLGFRVLDTPSEIFYAIFGAAALAAYISYALQNSRIGRAWVALREDESVAEAMGVNVVAAKLWAFVIGAALAGLAGFLFATTIGSIFPATFEIQQSIVILIIVIVGGLGSVPGVVVASLLLIALPELLREFREYRFLVYGALLIFMMLSRPEGLIPSRRRAAELREDERAQDEWLRSAATQEQQEGSVATAADAATGELR
jgi:branched-chain amino acid transport system permease protein